MRERLRLAAFLLSRILLDNRSQQKFKRLQNKYFQIKLKHTRQRVERLRKPIKIESW